MESGGEEKKYQLLSGRTVKPSLTQKLTPLRIRFSN